MDNPNIYNVEGYYRLSPGLQPLATGSMLKIRIYFQSDSFIAFSTPEIILLSSTKQNIQNFKHL